jgi:phosphofructokinase-like protein
MSKKIGILTSGGDCAGLNTALWSATIHGTENYQWDIVGIRQGTTGLLKDPLDVIPLSRSTFDQGLWRTGGTILGSINKNNPSSFPLENGKTVDRSHEISRAFQELELDGLIGIGGDGSMKILRNLTQKTGIPFIGIPKTIDNDLGCTEYAIGFTTAVDIATEALDRLRPTGASHDRVMILEVMGRDAGHIALASGIAGGADIILIPEIAYDLEKVAQKIKSVAQNGRHYALVVVAEGTLTPDGQRAEIKDPHGNSRYGGIGHYLADAITKMTGAETRFTVLGHVQRGAEPNSVDRLLAASFGVYAIDLLAKGAEDRMVAWQNRSVIDVPILDAIARYQGVRHQDTWVDTARGLGIYLGETL